MASIYTNMPNKFIQVYIEDCRLDTIWRIVAHITVDPRNDFRTEDGNMYVSASTVIGEIQNGICPLQGNMYHFLMCSIC